jgi:tetratricopeptide (TPR) repeat protein
VSVRFLGWCFALSLAVAPSAAEDADVEALFARAVGLHQGGDLAGAAALYERVLEAQPRVAQVRSNLGAAYAGLGRFDDAVVQYRLALEVEDDAAIRQNLALALLKSDRLEEAAAEAERLVAAQPQNRHMAIVAANCRLRLGEDQRVVELLTPLAGAASADEEKAVAYMLGTAMLNLGREAEAQVVMDRVFRDDSPEAHLLFGAMRARRGDAAAALAEYEKALAANPKIPLANFLTGQVLLERSDWAGAAAAFRREVEIDPNHYDANLLLGNLLRKEGSHEEALVYLERAARLRGSDVAAQFALGATQVALGRFGEAVPLLEKVRAQRPDHQPTRMQLAIAYTKLGRTEDAAREKAEAAKLQKDADARLFGDARERLTDILGRKPEPSPPPRTPQERRE